MKKPAPTLIAIEIDWTDEDEARWQADDLDDLDADVAEAGDADAGPLYDGPSKSQVKREHLALQDLARELLTVPRAELAALGLSERTWAAIDETARIRDLRALRRHQKRIASLLAREDTDALRVLLDARAAHSQVGIALTHACERWRDRLLGEGDGALTEFFADHPDAERQRLRQLVRDARRDAERGRPDGARRLFKELRAVLTAAQQPPNGDGTGDDDEDERPGDD